MFLTTYNQPALLNDDVFNFLNDSKRVVSKWQPAVDIQETDDAYTLIADVPGIADSDIEISAKNNVLTISGKREAVKEDKKDFYRVERSYGEFKRVFKLPTNVDAEAISAEKKDGVLTVAIPKRAAEVRKTIAIKSH